VGPRAAAYIRWRDAQRYFFFFAFFAAFFFAAMRISFS
jgi:hypothetical protein